MGDTNRASATFERPEDVQRVLDAHVETVEMIELLLKNVDTRHSLSTVIMDITPESTEFVLKKAIKTIELLSGYIKDLESEANALARDLECSYDTNKTLDKEITRLEVLLNKANKSCGEWIDSYFSVRDECAESYKEIHKLKNLLDVSIKSTDTWKRQYENSEKMLKAAISRIDDLYKRLTEVQNKSGYYTFKPYDCKYVIRFKHDFNSAYPTSMYKSEDKVFHNGSDFCGNCRYCQTTVSGRYICTQHYIKDIDPDDSSCSKFRAPYEKSEKSEKSKKAEKPDHECCANCDKKDDPDYCNYKCPLFPF